MKLRLDLAACLAGWGGNWANLLWELAKNTRKGKFDPPLRPIFGKQLELF